MIQIMDETVRWLTDEEQRVWREFLAAVTMLNEHLERRLQADAGMPHTYYAVLVALSEAPDRTMRMSDLAVRARFSRSRLSHAVGKMEADGWVWRKSCPSDRRGSFVTLTEDGFRVLKGVAPGHVTAVREALFDRLSDEQVRQLGEIGGAITGGPAGTCAAVEAAELADSES